MTDSPSLHLRSLCKRFGGIVALDSVSVSFMPGQVASIVGPNGAGKTTVFNVVGGFLNPDAGDVIHRGAVINRNPPYAIARRGIGRLFQDPRVFGRMTVLENVTVADGQTTMRWPLTGLFWPIFGRSREAANMERAARWLEFAGLTQHSRQPAGTLSFGQQKRIALVRLLNMGADCLLLDEPTAGLAPDAANSILSMVRQIADLGKTVVMVEHNFSAVRCVSDVVHVMDRGRVVMSGTPSEVLNTVNFGELMKIDADKQTAVG